MQRLHASLLAQHALVALAFRHKPLRLLFEQLINLLGGQRIHDAAARETGDRDAQLGCHEVLRVRSVLAEVLEPLRRIRLQSGELGAGDRVLLEFAGVAGRYTSSFFAAVAGFMDCAFGLLMNQSLSVGPSVA